MRVKMLRSLANRPDRVEGRVCETDDDEAADLIARQLAEPAGKPPKPGVPLKPSDPPIQP